ncbi:MAG TPA: ATP-dependent DNA helicase [Nocardioidaceae bacterium]|nr:ATP-dependent DNA helicase [Nocardioidaceae bacterium]
MPTYHLRLPSRERTPAPALDEFQRSVVEHPGGPLLVLAGPGTGKTTTLVEAIVDRIENRGADPASVLALTFSRKAAEQLRDRVTARLGATMATSLSSTFHSFAYALLRAYGPRGLYDEPLRLLSAPEQDVVLRELLEGGQRGGTVRWPAGLAQALRTRGFAREVAAVLARAREKGLDPEDLAKMAEQEGRADWQAAARFMEDYLTSLDFKAAVDYPELVHRAAVLASEPDVRRRLRERFEWIFVDEYQDTDPRQVALLRSLGGDGRNLVAVGDPDQSIYAFRGAEVRGILDFPQIFPTRSGARAPVVALRTARRFGPHLLAASRRIVRGIPSAGAIDAEMFRRFRDPVPAEPATGGNATAAQDRVDVRLYANARAETAAIADLLRRAHLEDGVGWSDMAVLVRSGSASLPPLRRALLAAGVPVEVAGDELPLVQEPAVAPLLAALEAAVDPDALSVEQAHALLTSPLGGLDAAEVRALGRQLRLRDRAEAGDQAPRASAQLLRDAVADPAVLVGVEGRAADKAGRLARLLARAHRDLGANTAEEVLWALWEGTPWRHQLRAAVDRGGHAARLAHRDLDAVCALFEVAARAEERQLHTSVETFLEELRAQEIPGDTLAERGVRGETVRLLTAHRSKGLEWRVVVVAGVQEGSWPDLRRRGSLLEADRIGTDDVLPRATTSMMLAEERRLFYVACTRARERLVVTAVQATEEDGDQPSRFVAELGVPAGEVRGRPPRPLSLPGLVAELRRVAGDDSRPALQEAAARRLARLAALSVEAPPEAGDAWGDASRDASGDARSGRSLFPGRPLVPQAHPDTWWGVRERTHAEGPLRPVDRPLTLSASALDGLVVCPTRWFLDREAAGSSGQSFSQGFGLVVHALADALGKGELVEPGDLVDQVERIWDQLSFETPWAREKQRTEVREVIERLVAWHRGRPDRQYLASEQPIEAAVELPDGERVVLRGFVDRLELDADGNVVVIDFKTSKSVPTREKVAQHPQLGLYQLALDHGAAADLAGPEARSGGAELVQLRSDDGGLPKVLPQGKQEPDESGVRRIESQLMQAAQVLRSEQIVATESPLCEHCAFQHLCPVKGSGTVLS